jgi:hypothetical protein
MKRTVLLSLASALLVSLPATSWGQFPVQPIPAATYTVKFLCGFQPSSSSIDEFPSEPPVKQGNYATAVNILNYHSFPITICKEARVAVPESCLEGNPPTGTNCKQFSGVRAGFILKSEQAVEVDCSDIVSILGTAGLPSFIKGFVEIFVSLSQPGGVPSTNPLAVTGVYTSQQCQSSVGGSCSTLFPGGVDVVPEISQSGELPLECQRLIGPPNGLP